MHNLQGCGEFLKGFLIELMKFLKAFLSSPLTSATTKQEDSIVFVP